ncbi:MAG TPA: TIGR01777 family oxidoreductase [Micromonospora sp.]|nr:TIGR01777 family oxidoreductase [Micromonospora sp.]
MRIIMAGASGFLGSHLVDRLTAQGHDVLRLVRRPPTGVGEIEWAPAQGRLDPTALAGADAVINLAGANIADRRWTRRFKEVLRASRVDATATIARTIAALPTEERPRALLNSSAIGWYGDTGDRLVEEDAPAGEGFMAEVGQVWEAAVRPAEEAGVRVVLLRSGLPLHRDGGFLKPQLLPFRLGLGGTFGSGRQWVPWLSLADWLSAVVFLLQRDDLSGPVNLVGPAPVTNAAFTKALGRALRRPAIWPVPGFALHLLLGGLAAETLVSHRVLPGVLNRAGFRFQHADLADALRAALQQ